MRASDISRRIAALALVLGAVGCDSLPGAFDPEPVPPAPVPATLLLRNSTSGTITDVIVHPYRESAECRAGAVGFNGWTSNIFRGTGMEYPVEVPSGCYVVWMHFFQQRGYLQRFVRVAAGDSARVEATQLPQVPAAGPVNGTMQLRNEAGPYIRLKRIYTDACRPDNELYGIGPTGGLSGVYDFDVEPGGVAAVNLPATCHFVRVLYNDGSYRFGNVTVQATSP